MSTDVALIRPILSIDYIIQMGKLKNGQRVISQICECTGIEGERISLQTIAQLKDNTLQFTGHAPKRLADLVDAGLSKIFFN